MEKQSDNVEQNAEISSKYLGHYGISTDLRLLNNTCSPFGLSSHSINREGIISNNIKNNIITLIILLMQTIMQIYGFLKYKDNPRYQESILKIAMVLQTIIWQYFPSLYVILEFLVRKRVKETLKDLTDCDVDLMQLTKAYKIVINSKQVILILTTFILVCLISSAISMFSDFSIFDETFDFQTLFIYVFAYYLFNMTLPFFVLKFVVVNFLIEQRISAINMVLERNKLRKENVSI